MNYIMKSVKITFSVTIVLVMLIFQGCFQAVRSQNFGNQSVGTGNSISEQSDNTNDSLTPKVNQDINEKISVSKYYVSRGGKQYGPFSESKMRELIQKGNVVSSDYVWTDGMKTWDKAGNIFNK